MQRISQSFFSDMLSLLLCEIFEDKVLRYSTFSAQHKLWCQIYEGAAALVTSRVMQNVHLRPDLSSLLLRIPEVPWSVLRLLKLLLVTGSKGSLRNESLNCFVALVFHGKKELCARTLNELLWSSLSDDMETRLKVISSLVR